MPQDWEYLGTFFPEKHPKTGYYWQGMQGAVVNIVII